MLGFFQKYQRFFFIFVTVMVVASFAFFGVFDTFTNNDKAVEDREIGKSVDGSPMMLLEVQRLSRFIATDAEDDSPYLNGTANLCNDGVIRNDLLRTGISDLLVSDYFEAMKGDLKQRLDRAKRYRGYENAEAPFISARSVWDRFMPSISKELEALKTEGEVSLSTFSHLSNLYQQQTSCPPEFLKRVLMYYSNQAQWIKPDPHLPYADLSLFGFHTVSDWFGSNFVDLSAQFILNAAKYAEQKGYQVTLEEAKADLVRNFQASMKKLSEKKHQKVVTFAEHLRSLGIDEKGSTQAWRSVLLFRRYFHAVGESTFMDQMPYRDFASFARDTYVVQKYEWPASLHLKTAQDLIEFQVYIHSIGGKLNALSLPSQFHSIDKVNSQTPELVQTTYRMKVAEISLEEVGLRATLKQILDWEMNDENWSELSKAFSFLEKGETKEARFKSLEMLSSENRKKIDDYARLEWAKKNESAMDEQLHKTPGQEKTVSIAQNWISLPEIENPRELGALIELSANGDVEVKKILERYSGPNNKLYRFEAIEKIKDLHVLTFQEAQELGVATLIADRFLEAEYKKIRSQFPLQFRIKENEWKLFASVKEEVAMHVFSDLIKQMGNGKEPLAYYAFHRLEIPAKQALSAFQKNSEDPNWLASSDENPISSQFKLVKNECSIQRTTKDEWMKEQVFIMMPNEWSPISVPADGNITFFYFDQRKETREPVLEQISYGKEVIAADAQRYVAKSLLSKLHLKKSIVIPVFNKEIE